MLNPDSPYEPALLLKGKGWGASGSNLKKILSTGICIQYGKEFEFDERKNHHP
jgi:hypothetical protein